MTTGKPFTATVLGVPRIGPNRELKKVIEKFWKGNATRAELQQTGVDLRAASWTEQVQAGLDSIPVNTFSYYDQVLDTTVALNAHAPRHRAVQESAAADTVDQDDATLAGYFAAARGITGVPPLEMTKWFDTNYHYLVPEISPETPFAARPEKILSELAEARGIVEALGKDGAVDTRPVLVGPYTYLSLSKAASGSPEGFSPLDRLDDIVAVYRELLGILADNGVEWVQIDEPALATDLSEERRALATKALADLAGESHRPAILLATYFGDPGSELSWIAELPVEGLSLDLAAGDGRNGTTSRRVTAVLGLPSETLDGKLLVAGVIDGRNVWRSDLDHALSVARLVGDAVTGAGGSVAVGTSCSLLHVPYTTEAEPTLKAEHPGLFQRLAFASEKIREVRAVADALTGVDGAEETLDAAREALKAAQKEYDQEATPAQAEARERLAAVQLSDRRRSDYEERVVKQQALGLPRYATTTIGSFPQTTELREARAKNRTGELDDAGYRKVMEDEVKRVIELQEELDIDVLVHGEPERNDMVQYFAEQLEGYAATENGWVQSYGSRCVRPPVLHGDVARPTPMTVEWATYAQSLTDRYVKGMLTGPVTMLAWSFIREDQPWGDTADQVGLAIADEVRDLEAAGIRIIQVDEPALREKLPLRTDDQEAYLTAAVESFRLSTSSVSDETQIHTHMCYSEFGEVIGVVADLDADVTSMEAARSDMEVVADLDNAGFHLGIGPGIYDIHSPRVPEVEELTDKLRRAAEVVPGTRLWVNPDCGLKTRGYEECTTSLRHMVEAAKTIREEFAAK